MPTSRSDQRSSVVASTGRAGEQVRLDTELVRRGLARSRDDASELIGAGAVQVGRHIAHKSAARVTTSTRLAVHRATPAYVSRGADKLVGALDDFATAGLTVTGRRGLDVGASTGGFTQVLLAAGATTVVAVDVGSGQLAAALAADPRVVVRDGINARSLSSELVGMADIVVVDLSFISLRLVLAGLAACLAADGDLLVMVKPQFEVGRRGLDGRGVVRDRDEHLAAICGVAAAAAELRLETVAATASRRPGAVGNVEYFLWLRHGDGAVDAGMLEAAVDGGPA